MSVHRVEEWKCVLNLNNIGKKEWIFRKKKMEIENWNHQSNVQNVFLKIPKIIPKKSLKQKILNRKYLINFFKEKCSINKKLHSKNA